MPNVDGKEFPYTKKGKADAKKAMKKKKGKKSGKEMKFSADDGGSISGPMNPKRKKVLDEIKANNSKPTPSMRNTTPGSPLDAPKPAPKPMGGAMPKMPPTPAPRAMGAGAGAAMGAAAAGAMGGGMGMPPKKPPMPGMKAGGKVKKKAKTYKSGGKVRGAGIAKQGVRKCKMR